HGPGLRWAAVGPHMAYHLGGGEGGIRHYLEHLGPSQVRRWASLGSPSLDDATRAALIEGVLEEAGGRSIAELEAERDALLQSSGKTPMDPGWQPLGVARIAAGYLPRATHAPSRCGSRDRS